MFHETSAVAQQYLTTESMWSREALGAFDSLDRLLEEINLQAAYRVRVEIGEKIDTVLALEN
uniref:Uncharacterized protein n=1 Tax=Oryza glumipatula TaxID=40148 RepID=A0A0E0BLZ1_9ORYZ